MARAALNLLVAAGGLLFGACAGASVTHGGGATAPESIVVDVAVAAPRVEAATVDMDASTDAASASPGSAVVEGRVEDDQGQGVEGVALWFVDTTRVRPVPFDTKCGTYHPQETLFSGADGRFSATLDFQPNRVSVESTGPWLKRLSYEPQPVTPGAPVVVRLQRISHRTVIGDVVDVAGAPVSGARVSPLSGSGSDASTGDDGRFEIEAEEPTPNFRVRRMGFRPVVLEASQLSRVTLEPRPVVTVTVLEPASGKPVTRLVRVSLHQGGALVSYCTAGWADQTHEPTDGACSLDAELGVVELRVEGEAVGSFRLTTQAHALTAVAPPPRPVDAL